EMTPREIWDVAERCNNMERLFNIREGLTRDDPAKGDVLNHRYHDEPCRRGAPDVVGRLIEKDKFLKMREEVYEHKGWDENGVPTPETLQRLGIDKEPSHLV
ncbi:MAG: aldehyde ferredoxin oxidoreductase, partial [Deltaproteobacteria bacterium]|nr:aldehyde ferredoxin oxidoreductase [Deltaproteobacteria bacterium]